MTDSALLLLLFACIPVIFGSKWFWTDFGMVQHPCPKCGAQPTLLRQGRQRAHVYHIPLFKTKESYAVRCEACDADWMIDDPTGLQLRIQTYEAIGAAAPPAVKEVTEPTPAKLTEGAASGPAACTKCGGVLNAGAKFCTSCGTAVVQPDVCPNCGVPRGPGRFCGHCGTELPALATSGPSPQRTGQPEN